MERDVKGAAILAGQFFNDRDTDHSSGASLGIAAPEHGQSRSISRGAMYS